MVVSATDDINPPAMVSYQRSSETDAMNPVIHLSGFSSYLNRISWRENARLSQKSATGLTNVSQNTPILA